MTYDYSFSFGQGPGAWRSWMAPDVVSDPGGIYSSYTRFQAPGTTDPNHIDGIGPIFLLSHLSIPQVGTPGVLNLTNADIDVTIRTEDFQANGTKLYFWIIRYLPDGTTVQNYQPAFQSTNWANTANNLLTGVGSEWTTVSVHLSPDPADWTYAGNNVTSQGDWAYRYVPYSLADTLAQVDATLHLVFVGDRPDQGPTGFIDIANITIHAQTPASGPSSLYGVPPAPAVLARGIEDQPVTGQLGLPAGVNAATARWSLVAGTTTHGVATIDATTGTYSFAPEANYWGPSISDTAAGFEYAVTDATGNTDRQLASFFIAPVNDAPVASNWDEGTTINVDEVLRFTVFVASDADQNRLSYHLIDGSVSHGSMTLDAATGRYVFTPEGGYSGTAQFSYYVSDGTLDSAPKTVSIAIAPPSAPYVLPNLQAASDLLLAGDVQGFAKLIIRLAEAGDPNASYFYGSFLRGDRFVTRNDAAAVPFLLAANPVNLAEAKLELADAYMQGDGVPRDYALAREALLSIASSPTAQYKLGVLDDLGYGGPVDKVAAVSHFLTGAKGGNADAMYTLGRRYLAGDGAATQYADAYFWLGLGVRFRGGPDLVQFHDLLAYDMGLAAAHIDAPRRAELDAAIANWAVGAATPVDDAPELAADAESATGNSGTTIAGVLLAGSDADRDTLHFQFVPGTAQHGTVTIDTTTGSYAFVPDAAFAGAASFAYRLSDGQTTSAAKIVAIDVVPVTSANSDAAALTETATVTRTAATGVLSNDLAGIGAGPLQVTAVDGNVANVGVPLQGSFGTLTLAADGSYVYQASAAQLTAGQSPNDVFVYTATDSFGVTATASLRFTVGGVGGTILSGNGTLTGSAYDDVITGGSGSDYLLGLDGNDRLIGGEGATNALQGGKGDDIYVVGAAGDSVFELPGEGTDTVETAFSVYTLSANVENLTYTGSASFAGLGNAAANVIIGGAGDDAFAGFEGDDTLLGMGGNDLLIGGSGNNTLDGGVGIDTAYYLGAPSGVSVDLSTGTASANGYGGVDTLTGVETVSGTDFADVIIGDAGANTLLGNGGDDELEGGGGNDVLLGGVGSDTASFRSAPAGVSVDLAASIASDGYGTADTLIGIENATGSRFADQLRGDGGANILTGGAGDDLLDGRAGADRMIGGTGDDIVFVDDMGDTAIELPGEGHDTVRTTLAIYELAASFEVLEFVGNGNFTGTGNDLANRLVGGAGNDRIDGGAGDDVIVGGAGDNLLIGGDGVDAADYSATTGTLIVDLASGVARANGAGGSDSLSGIESVIAGSGPATIMGSALDDVLTGGGGNDTLAGRGGNNRLVGGAGMDTASYAEASGSVVANLATGIASANGFGGSDILIGIERLVGGAANDVLSGGVDGDILEGGAGDDVLAGGAGNNVLIGGSGNDTADYGATTGTLFVNLPAGTASANGAGGADTLAGIENVVTGAGSSTVIGDAQDNILTGGAGSDYLIGGAGNDVLAGGGGATNALQGGTGDDVYVVSVAGDSLIEFAGEGIDTVRTALASYVLRTNFENLVYVGSGTFTGTGSSDDNLLVGGANGDTLYGMAGNDSLDGGAGDDVLAGGAGNNVLTGGAGIDTADYGATTGTLFVNLPTGRATSNGAGGSDTLSGIENIVAGSGAATVIGDAGDNVVTGGTAADYLIGGAGNDTLAGGTGAANALQGGTGDDIYIVSVLGDTIIEYAGEGIDTVRTALSSYTLRANLERLVYTGSGSFTGTGNAADNELTGGSGNDTLDGGLGNDVMTGGGGDDIYIVDALGDAVVELAGGGTDTVRTGLSSYTLGNQVERLVFTGTGSFAGTGNALANAIVGGSGNDTLDGGAGADLLTGGGGNDVYLIDDAGDLIVEIAGGGSDTARVSAASYTLGAEVEALVFVGTGSFSGTGNASANTLTGGADDDSLSGAGGDDLLIGLGGNNVFDGGSGTDTVSYAGATGAVTGNFSTGLVSANGYGGSDTITGIEKLIGSAFGDRLTGGNADDSLDGGAGDDVLAGGAGNNVLTGGAGIDTADYGATTGTLFVNLPTGRATSNGAGGSDTLSGIENIVAGSGAATVIGDAGDNVVTGGTAADYLIGGAGNDTLAGGTGAANALQGGTGDDLYVVSVLGDTIIEYAGEGIDTVRTALSSYTLRANLERLVYTGSGSFTGTGNAADNELTGGSGNDTLDGGLGNDVVVVRGLRTTYEIVTEGGLLKIRDLAPGVDGDDGTDTLIGVERVRFGDGETITLGAPIALDLDGGGVQLLAAGMSGARDATGNALSWVGSGDGVLFLDRDRDGGYSGVGEMTFTGDRAGATSDLDGLRVFDTTGDDILDARDDAFASFMVWRDANGNGVADAGETGSLVRFGIQSISLVGIAVNSTTKVGETAVVNTGSFTRSDGTTGAFADVVLTSTAASPQSPLVDSLVSCAAQELISARPLALSEPLLPLAQAMLVS